jgi:hypothetical protein
LESFNGLCELAATRDKKQVSAASHAPRVVNSSKIDDLFFGCVSPGLQLDKDKMSAVSSRAIVSLAANQICPAK